MKITNKEKKFDSHQMIVSKTDAKGTILFANENFIKISGYREDELVGKPHSLLRHPHMPKAIYHYMWKKLKEGKNVRIPLKNRTKSGDHYWVTTDFEIRRNRDGEIEGYIAFRHAAPRHLIKEIEPLYTELRDIETKLSLFAAVQHLESMLAGKGMDFDEYIKEITESSVLSRFKGLLTEEISLPAFGFR